jgi:hypothetical protein
MPNHVGEKRKPFENQAVGSGKRKIAAWRAGGRFFIIHKNIS